LNSKLHAVTDGDGRPIALLLTEGQMNDHMGAKLLYPALPEAKLLIADKGYDSDEFRVALKARGIAACIPPKRNRRLPSAFDKIIYKQRHKIENMFGRLKDWRRISTRYDRCAHTFFSAICIAASFIFYLNQ
jgi:transposase